MRVSSGFRILPDHVVIAGVCMSLLGCTVDDSGGRDAIQSDSSIDVANGDPGGSAQVESTLYKSGSRIKAKVLVTADGAQAFQGWYDSQLGVDCTFYPVADGTTRCVPYQAFASPSATSSFFTDSECRNPVAYVPAAGCRTVPKYALTSVGSSDGCAGYQVNQVSVETTNVFMVSGEACISTPNDSNSSLRFFILGNEVTSDFVEADVKFAGE